MGRNGEDRKDKASRIEELDEVEALEKMHTDYVLKCQALHDANNRIMVLEAELQEIREEKRFPAISLNQMEQISDLKRKHRLIDYDFDKGVYVDGGPKIRASGQSEPQIDFKETKSVSALFQIPLSVYEMFDMTEMDELREYTLTAYRTKLRELINKHRSST